jgi:hypothetical protein
MGVLEEALDHHKNLHCQYHRNQHLTVQKNLTETDTTNKKLVLGNHNRGEPS